MKLSEVTYYTEDPGQKYSVGLSRCTTLEELKTFLNQWEGLVDDAKAFADTMTEKDFKTFQKCLKIERAGRFSGMKNSVMVSTLCMPELMFKATTTALQFTVPWGTAVIRLKSVASAK